MWSVKLTDPQRDAVTALIRAQGELGPSLSGALEALSLARWDDLPDAELPWHRVSELAAAQDISEADVVRDLAAGLHASPSGSSQKGIGSMPRNGRAARRNGR